MTDDARAHPSLAALGPAARRAVATAEAEARALGHDRVGTEHLLLGVLADEGSAASLLRRAGAALPVARRKVLEVRPALAPPPPPDRALELTGRASRALGRSVRFSHGSPEGVTVEHLLTGILDVEGTAGQVLRSLGIDVEQVRAALDAGARSARPSAPPAEEHARPAAKPLRCPTCGIAIGDDLTWHAVRARGDHGPRDVVVVACGACGTALGTVPA